MHSQLSQATLRLREMILRHVLCPGERVTEARLAAMLGMSRTPVRQALPLLAQEGLLTRQPTRGYVVRHFTARDIADAIETARGFYMGMQGHPEIASRTGHPHPVIRAFVAHTQRRAIATATSM